MEACKTVFAHIDQIAAVVVTRVKARQPVVKLRGFDLHTLPESSAVAYVRPSIKTATANMAIKLSAEGHVCYVKWSDDNLD